MATIDWLPWNGEAFARARRQGKPVLLSIAPAWCWHSREMDRTSYADPDIRTMVNSQFVPVRVDADRRPDVSVRYGLGGWPTTAFLTADGQVIGGGTYIDAVRLRDVLQRVSGAFASGRHLGARCEPERSSLRQSPPPSIEGLVQDILDGYDAINGGFGTRPKFPHVAPVHMAMALYRETGSQQYYDVAVTTLDAMGWGPLYDEERGGFFSYSEEEDWGRPNEAKLLEVNAALLSLYIEALETFRFARYGERAEGVLRYTQTWLADQAEGGWAASERPGAAGTSPVGESPAETPAVDLTLYADRNAMMASAALHAGRVLDDRSLAEFAIKSLERLLLLAFRPGSGVAHYVDGGEPHVRGLLEDQVAMASAALDAFEATGDVVYEMMAEELALYATRAMWDEASAGFFDRTTDPRRDIGLLKDPVKPVHINCLAARMLRRVARTSGSSEFDLYADRTLAAVAGDAAAAGPLAAEYVLAARAAAAQ